MTKEELKIQTEAIVSKFGKPLWDMCEPTNDSARKIAELRNTYRMSCLALRRDEKKRNGYKTRSEGLKEIAEGIKKDNTTGSDMNTTDSMPLPQIPEILLDDKDLIAFTEKEKEILRCYFANVNQSYKKVANYVGVPYQQVTALFNTAAFKILYSKVFDRILPIDSLITIRQALKRGDSKVALEVARHYKLISNEALDINHASKLIDDPKAIKMLKELGDSLA